MAEAVDAPTPYMKVRNALAPCRTLADLSHAWTEHQETMRTMEQGQRAALVAMKDFYKGLIKRGQIDDYLQCREEAANRQWTGQQVQQSQDQNGSRMVRQQGRTSKVAVSSGRRKARGRR